MEELMRGSGFIFDSVTLLYCHLQKISLIKRKSNVDSPKWPNNKKTKINRKSKDNNCIQYALTVALR